MKDSDYYLIPKNQIDDMKDRQVDLSEKNDNNEKIKKRRAIEGKGLLLIYALDERATPNVNNQIPIIGYSLHFPRISDEVKVSYTATVNKDFDNEVMEDDDNPEADNL